MSKSNKIIMLIIIIAIITIVCFFSIFLKSSKSDETGYIETHMEYEPDKNYIKNSQNAIVNDNPIIPAGYYRQQINPVEGDNICIIYYIPEKYINGNNKLKNINGNNNVSITTKVSNIDKEIQYLEIEDYINSLIENDTSDSVIKSCKTIDCENKNFDILISEYDTHTSYELIFIYNNKAYSIIYDISNKANSNEIGVMKKVFASTKLVDYSLLQEQ